MELIDLANSFIILNDLTQMVDCLTPIPECYSHSHAHLDLFISSDASICSAVAFPPLENSGMLWSHFPFTFLQTQKGCPFLSHNLLLSLCWLDGLHDRLRDVPLEDILNSVLLVLVLNFGKRSRLELMYISLMVNIRSSLIHLHGFQLLVLLP